MLFDHWNSFHLKLTFLEISGLYSFSGGIRKISLTVNYWRSMKYVHSALVSIFPLKKTGLWYLISCMCAFLHLSFSPSPNLSPSLSLLSPLPPFPSPYVCVLAMGWVEVNLRFLPSDAVRICLFWDRVSVWIDFTSPWYKVGAYWKKEP